MHCHQPYLHLFGLPAHVRVQHCEPAVQVAPTGEQDFVGYLVGDLVGNLVGALEGGIVGGDVVGLLLGTAVGGKVGGDGAFVSAFVGVADGAFVGGTVGLGAAVICGCEGRLNYLSVWKTNESDKIQMCHLRMEGCTSHE